MKDFEKIKRYVERVERLGLLVISGAGDIVAEERMIIAGLWRDMSEEERGIATDLVEAHEFRQAGKLN